MAITDEIFAIMQEEALVETNRRQQLREQKIEEGIILDPEAPRRQVTIPTTIGGGEFSEFEATQGLEEFLLGGEEFLSERGLGDPVRAPDTLAANVGRAAAPVAGAIAIGLTPGLNVGVPAILAQGAFAATLEGLREGSTPEDIRNAAFIAGGGQLGANTISRVLTGSAAGRGIGKGRPVTFGEGIDDSLIGDIARGGRGAGSLRFADRLNQKLLYNDTARALGFTPSQASRVASINRPFLQQARGNINRSYGAAAPTSPVDVQQTLSTLNKIPKEASPAVNDLVTRLEQTIATKGGLEPEQWRALNRAVGDARTKLRRNDVWGEWADVVTEAQNDLADAAGAAGGNRELLIRTNQQFKLLESLEEIPSVINAERFTASQLNSKLARDNFKGFGKRFVAEGSDSVNPEIQALSNDARAISKFEVESAGGSQTAGREAAIRDPLTFVGLQAAGRASVGDTLLAPIGRAAAQAEAVEGFGGPSLIDLIKDVPGVLDESANQ